MKRVKVRSTLKQFASKALFMTAILAATTNAQADFKVVGYFPSWSGNVDTLAYDKLTHINYSFLKPTKTGGLQELKNTKRLRQLVTNAHNNDVKVLIAIGGWMNGDDDPFVQLAANKQHRADFVTNILNFVNQYDLDGVDMDWEFPDKEEVPNFKLLMQELDIALNSQGKLLTAAVSQSDSTKAFDADVIATVDYLNLMAYDNNSPHSTYQHAVESISYWKNKEGLSQEKIVLGVPFYSRTGDRPSYKDIIATYGKDAAWMDNAGGHDYNGIPTIKAKTKLSLEQAGGIMYWEASKDTQDETSLMSAIWDTVNDNASYSEWIQSTQYYTDDIVIYQDNYYIAEHDNPGYKPTTSTWYWEPVNAWQSKENYTAGDIVEFNGQLYITEQDNPGYNPSSSTWYWDPI